MCTAFNTLSRYGKSGAEWLFGKRRELCSTTQPPGLPLRGIYSTAAAHSKFKIKVCGNYARSLHDDILTLYSSGSLP